MSFDSLVSLLGTGLAARPDDGLQGGFVSELLAAFRQLAAFVVAILLFIKLKGVV